MYSEVFFNSKFKILRKCQKKSVCVRRFLRHIFMYCSSKRYMLLSNYKTFRERERERERGRQTDRQTDRETILNAQTVYCTICILYCNNNSIVCLIVWKSDVGKHVPNNTVFKSGTQSFANSFSIIALISLYLWHSKT